MKACFRSDSIRDEKSYDGFTSTAKRGRVDTIADEPNVSLYYALKDLHLIHTKIGRYDDFIVSRVSQPVALQSNVTVFRCVEKTEILHEQS